MTKNKPQKNPQMTIFGSLAIPKKPAPKPMTPRELERALEQLSLSVYGGARVLGVSLRQLQRLAAGKSPVPRPVAKLINLLLKGRINVKETIEAG